jgi:hypothetical protein
MSFHGELALGHFDVRADRKFERLPSPAVTISVRPIMTRSNSANTVT